jgi:hypothetical protein
MKWITTSGGLLLWAELLLAWAVIHYATLKDPTGAQEASAAVRRSLKNVAIARGVALFGFLLLVAGISAPSITLAMFCGVIAAVVPVVRTRLSSKGMGAEAEIAGTGLFVGLTGWIIAAADLEASHGLFRLPLPANRISVLCIAVALFLFMGRGGTHVVRGILDKVGTIPTEAPDSGSDRKLDTREYNRGRIIGNIERALLAVTVALGAYEAMGLILAAKGLVRIKQFEEVDFAEYFLIGTLTSVTVAFVLGWLLRLSVVNLW